ncbi:MAG: hypothetical protein QW594_01635 [Candidatus Woesearchaeota archaeon]
MKPVDTSPVHTSPNPEIFRLVNPSIPSTLYLTDVMGTTTSKEELRIVFSLAISLQQKNSTELEAILHTLYHPLLELGVISPLTTPHQIHLVELFIQGEIAREHYGKDHPLFLASMHAYDAVASYGYTHLQITCLFLMM